MPRFLGLPSLCLSLLLLCSCSAAGRYAPSEAYEDGYLAGYRNGLAESGLRGYSRSLPGAHADPIYLQGWRSGRDDALLAMRVDRPKAVDAGIRLCSDLSESPSS